MLDVVTIGQVVRHERKNLGLRQDELAAASGVGLRFVVELERGKATAQTGKVIAVLAALGCELQIRTPGGTMAGACGCLTNATECRCPAGAWRPLRLAV